MVDFILYIFYHNLKTFFFLREIAKAVCRAKSERENAV